MTSGGVFGKPGKTLPTGSARRSCNSSRQLQGFPFVSYQSSLFFPLQDLEDLPQPRVEQEGAEARIRIVFQTLGGDELGGRGHFSRLLSDNMWQRLHTEVGGASGEDSEADDSDGNDGYIDSRLWEIAFRC